MTKDFLEFELIYAILDQGKASKFLHKAMDFGIRGGTVMYGAGTVRNKWLEFLSLNEVRKEIIMMGAPSAVAKTCMKNLNEHFKMHKPNHGIMFSTKLEMIKGTNMEMVIDDGEGEANSMYKLILTIVNKGRAEDVVDAAKEKGANGATIINARGSGVNENFKVFNMDIEPEKEMVMIIVAENLLEAIIENIQEKLELDQAGNGVLFVQNLNRVYGIYEQNK